MLSLCVMTDLPSIVKLILLCTLYMANWCKIAVFFVPMTSLRKRADLLNAHIDVFKCLFPTNVEGQ